MATITVRGLDDLLHARLKIRAAENGRSMEEEARMILRQALEPEGYSETDEGFGLFTKIRSIFAEIGYWDFDADALRQERGVPGRRDQGLWRLDEWAEETTGESNSKSSGGDE